MCSRRSRPFVGLGGSQKKSAGVEGYGGSKSLDLGLGLVERVGRASDGSDDRSGQTWQEGQKAARGGLRR